MFEEDGEICELSRRPFGHEAPDVLDAGTVHARDALHHSARLTCIRYDDMNNSNCSTSTVIPRLVRAVTSVKSLLCSLASLPASVDRADLLSSYSVH